MSATEQPNRRDFMKDRMKYLYTSRKTADVQFVVPQRDGTAHSEQYITAHRNILASASDAFETMFYGSFDTPQTIVLEGCTAEAWQCIMKYAMLIFSQVVMPLLRYIYLDEIAIEMEDSYYVLFFSKQYMLHRLFEQTVQFVKSKMTVQNVCSILPSLIVFDELKESLLEFADKNADAVIRSDGFCGLPHEVMLATISRDSLVIREIVLYDSVVKMVFLGILCRGLLPIFAFWAAVCWSAFAAEDNGYYGPGSPKPDDVSIKPFKIHVPDETLQDLKLRLKHARIGHQPLDDVDDFEYGFNLKTLQKFRDYWSSKYDWRKWEKVLNKHPQFTTEIAGLKIHFIHAKPPAGKYKTVVPLLIVHGWPGNVFEFYKAIPMLTDPAAYIKNAGNELAFEVVAPSIPGFGWSDQPAKKGCDQVATAHIFNKLMTKRLGFRKYVAQGGDWGSIITADVARLYPEK
ncbi:Protein W01A11.1 [Aphelenchoides avenae]|nr:Protein W01A11.1 [Aphelenchus avenae]